jgi:ABC-type nitrate/sulfonate/bicarbonate transport system substrate-binding protein
VIFNRLRVLLQLITYGPKLRGAIGASIALLFALWALTAGNSTLAQSSELQKVRIVVAIQSSCCANFLDGLVAKSAGTFQEEGLDVDWQPAIPSASMAMAAVLRGNTDVALISAFGAIAAAGADRPAKIFAGRPIGNWFGIAVRPQFAARLAAQGINPQSTLTQRLAALKGSTVFSASSGGPVWVAWRVALSAAGLNPDRDVAFQFGAPDVGIAAFRSGQLDATPFCCEPSARAAMGDHVIWATPEEMRVYWDKGYFNVWATTAEFAKDHPVVLERIVRGLIRNTELYEKDRSRVIASLKSLFPGIAPNILADSFDYNKPAFSVDPELHKTIVQQTIDGYNEGIQQKVNLKPEDLVPASFLHE